MENTEDDYSNLLVLSKYSIKYPKSSAMDLMLWNVQSQNLYDFYLGY